MAKTKQRGSPAATKIPITRRALIQRINRALQQRDEQLRAARGPRQQRELGDYWILDLRKRCVASKNIDPEKLARELGVLQPYESVEE